MIRKLAGALLCALMLVDCTPRALHSSDDAVAVLLRDGKPSCSAFAVGKHEILTATHCVRGTASLAVVPREMWDTTSDAFAPVEIASIDDFGDIALLHTDFTFERPLKTRSPKEGEKVEAIGAVYKWARSYGETVNVAGNFSDSTLTIKHGWSGSPVIGQDGAALGVLVTCRGKEVNGKHECAPQNARFSILP